MWSQEKKDDRVQEYNEELKGEERFSLDPETKNLK